MMRAFVPFLLAIPAITVVASAPKHAVRQSAEAIKIAVAASEPIYGAAHIAHEKPYQARLHSGIWTVTSSLPKGFKGGVAVADISAEDGSIIRVTHGKYHLTRR
jgi:hypothetical protein